MMFGLATIIRSGRGPCPRLVLLAMPWSNENLTQAGTGSPSRPENSREANAYHLSHRVELRPGRISMSPETTVLQNLLQRARRRRQLLLTLRGIAICLGVVAAVLLLSGWTAHRFRTNNAAILVLRIGALLAVLATIYFALIQPLLRRISDARLARLIEEKSPGTEDRLVASVEYADDRTNQNISPALIHRLHADANYASNNVNIGDVIRRSRLLTYGAGALASLLIFAAVLKWGPREISEGVAQLVAPTTFAASTNAMSIRVKPGTARFRRVRIRT